MTDPDDRFCRKCGWEARAAAPVPCAASLDCTDTELVLYAKAAIGRQGKDTPPLVVLWLAQAVIRLAPSAAEETTVLQAVLDAIKFEKAEQECRDVLAQIGKRIVGGWEFDGDKATAAHYRWLIDHYGSRARAVRDLLARLRGEATVRPETVGVDVQLLAWAVSNCHTLARRRLNSLDHDRQDHDALATTEKGFWLHVQRICEKAGAKSAGVLRASLPTEITDGSAAVRVEE